MSVTEEIISREALAKLPEYSCSIPTGTTIGKRWRRDIHFNRMLNGLDAREPEWMVVEYVDIGSVEEIGIRSVWALDENREIHRGDLK